MLGVAYPAAGRDVSHSSWPVVLSNARNFASMVAEIKTRPPAVTIGPPYCSAPVATPPFPASAGCSPSGILQRYAPVLRSIALSVPHGGLMTGNPAESRQRS